MYACPLQCTSVLVSTTNLTSRTAAKLCISRQTCKTKLPNLPNKPPCSACDDSRGRTAVCSTVDKPGGVCDAGCALPAGPELAASDQLRFPRPARCRRNCTLCSCRPAGLAARLHQTPGGHRAASCSHVARRPRLARIRGPPGLIRGNVVIPKKTYLANSWGAEQGKFFKLPCCARLRAR